MNKIQSSAKATLFQQINTFFKTNKFPVIIFIIAFIVRFIYLIDYSNSPFFQGHLADANFHVEWAGNILKGDIFSAKIPGVLYKAPLYPYIIAFIYFLSGNSDFVLMIFQIIMSSFSCVLIFLIGRKYFNEIAALISAMVYTFYFPSIFFSTAMEIPAIAIFLTLVSFYLLILNKKNLHIIISSIIFGFSILALPTNLLLIPLYVVILLKKHRIQMTLIFIIVTFATIFPCSLRNIIIGKQVTLISANGGINFYIGNNDKYDETVYMQPGYEFESFYDEPRRMDGADSFSERDHYWYQKAFGFIFNNPVKETLLIFKKLVLYFSDYEIYRNTDSYYAKDTSIYKYVPFFPASFILATGITGLFLAMYRKKKITLIALCILLALPCIIFFVTDRYKLPSMCIWTVFSGFCLFEIVNSIKTSKWTTGIIAVAAVICLVILSGLNIFVVKNPEYRPYFNLGLIYEQQGKYNQALKEYSKSLDLLKQEKPHDFKTKSEAYTRIGNVYMKLNNLDTAWENFNTALDIHPNSYPTYSYLGTLYEKKNQDDLAIRMYKKAIDIDPLDTISIYNLGLLYLKKNIYDEAMNWFFRVIEVYPRDWKAHNNLAYIYGMQGNFELMEKHVKKAILYNPEDAPSRFNLALLYSNTGRMEEAIQQYKKIIEISPNDAGNAYNSLGVIFARKNDLKQAIRYWEKALKIAPDLEDAKVNLQKAREIMGQ